MKINIRHFIIISILSFVKINTGFSQNKMVVDSLLLQIQKDIPGKEKVDTYVQLSYEYYFTIPEKSFKYAQKASELAKKIDYVEGEIQADIKLANLFRKKGDFTKSLELLNKCLSESKKNNYKIGEADAYRGLGIFYDIRNKYEISLDYYQESLTISKNINYKYGIKWATHNIATLYSTMGNYDKALDLSYAILNDKNFKDEIELLSMCYGNIGNIHNNLGEHDKALDSFFKSLELISKDENKHDVALNYNNIGNTYFYKEQTDKALEFYLKALQIKEEVGDTENLSTSLSNISSVYKMKGDYNQALHYLNKGLKINTQLDDKDGIASNYLGIAEVYKVQKKYNKALEYNYKSLELYKEIDNDIYLGRCYVSLGTIYSAKEEYEKALDNYFQAEHFFQKYNKKKELGTIYSNIGAIFERQNNHQKSEIYLQKALSIGKETNSSYVSTYPMIIMGKILQKQNKFKDAKSYYQNAFSLASKIGDYDNIKTSLFYLYKLEKKLGNYKTSLKHHEEYIKLTDSVSSDELVRKITEIETELAYTKQKDSIQFANMKEKMTLNQTIEQQRLIQNFALAGLLILLVIIYILYRFYTSKKEANVLLNQQKDELASLDKHKSRFFANISHELRTPITLIKGPVEYITKKESNKLSTDIKKHLKLINRNTAKLSNLVDDILDLSKLDAKKMEVNLESTNIPFLISRIFESYHSLADQRGISYELQSTIPEDTFVLLDTSKTEKIIANLLSNAIKHTPEKEKIIFSCSIQNQMLEFQVKDTGNGIPKKDLPFIFDRYFQSTQPDAPLQGGTGIGLSLAKEYTKLLKGTITAESMVGIGSTFTVKLPYTPAEKPNKSHKSFENFEPEIELIDDRPISIKKNNQAHNRILIVEDHPELLRFLKSLLENKYQIAVAMNGKQALAHLSKNTVDLIISDGMMPEMDGFELLKTIRNHKLYQEIPIIMLTALVDESNKLDALSMGVDDYLAKPFTPKELMARVENMLARYAIRKEQGDNNESVAETTTENPVALERGKVFIQKVEKRMIQELENEEFSIEKLAEEFFLSNSQFRRKIKQYTGLSPKQFQREIAMQNARDLLETKQYGNLTAVAYSVGIRNVTRFAKLYEDRFGKKPSDYFLEIGL